MATITGTSGDDNLSGTTEADQIYGLEGNDSLSGGDDDDQLQGGAGDDDFDGGAGRDTVRFDFMTEGVAVDLLNQIITGEGNDTIVNVENVFGTIDDDVLIGDGEANELNGDRGADTISGGMGNDRLESGPAVGDGVDLVDGGGDDDEVRIGANDFATGGPGFDSLYISLFNNPDGTTIDLSQMWSGGVGTNGTGTISEFERVVMVNGSAAADTIIVGDSGVIGNDAPPIILGQGGDDQLTGGAHRDFLQGGEGDDILIGLGGNDALVGLEDDDRLEGGAGDDDLSGGLGSDTLIGGAGSDRYIYSDDVPASDEIVEQAADEGTDKLYIVPLAAVGDAAFTGVRNIELVELNTLTDLPGFEAVLGTQFEATGIRTIIAAADIDASAVTSDLTLIVTPPNIRDLTITGGSGDDLFQFAQTVLPPFAKVLTLDGGDGTDTVQFRHGIELTEHPAHNGELVLSGFEAALLSGGTGAVSQPGPDLYGSSESYSFVLTNAWVASGVVFTVDATTLKADIIVALGADNEIGGTGANADTLFTDQLNLDASALGANRAVAVYGGAGADTFIGSAGNDLLDGGGGADSMSGGAGHDTYFVDDPFDTIGEAGGGGTDSVSSSVSYTLASNVENLTLTGTAFEGTGNGAPNTLVGNEVANQLSGAGGNDSLNGGAGADTMTGGTGHDTYYVDNVGDVVVEAGQGGTDIVYSSVGYSLSTHVERIFLTGNSSVNASGNTADNVVTGNAGNNILRGGAGNDRIDGGSGSDYLYGDAGHDDLVGGAGADRFAFNAALGTTNVDDILDFSVPNDTIYLARSIFTAAGANGTLSAAAFHTGTVAADAGDRIVHDQATGNIFYDSDGTGAAAAILFATVAAGTPLTNADFVIYS